MSACGSRCPIQAPGVEGGRPQSAVGAGGLLLTTLAMIVATIPPSDTAQPWLFRLKVIGGAALFVLLGGVVYWRARRRQRAGCLQSSYRACGDRSSLGLACMRRRQVPAVCGLLVPGLLLRPAMAQREPVLRQIKVPHSYYYREMYLPQLTSGPSACDLVTRWPGADLLDAGLALAPAARQQGSTPAHLGSGIRLSARLVSRRPPCRVRVVSTTTPSSSACWTSRAARPGRWSPTAAVNVEPRWSPDGTRLAFVSIGFEGRWHIFIATGARRRYARPRRSGSPKTGTAGCHATTMAPTTSISHRRWSPDGKDLIFISNRGHIWGSGGFWRMAAQRGGARRGASLRGNHLEGSARLEPRRQAGGLQLLSRRPVASALAHDRRWRRSVSAHLSARATPPAPAGLPTAERIAYISNEDGNTELRIVERPGRSDRAAAQRSGGSTRSRWRRLAITVIDRMTGRSDARASLDHRDRMAEASRRTMPGATPTTASIASSGASSTATSIPPARRRLRSRRPARRSRSLADRSTGSGGAR